MANNRSIQILRVDSEDRFNTLFQQQGLGSLSVLDGQPLYVKDKARLYIGNDSFSTQIESGATKKLFMPVVAPYKHTIHFQIRGGGGRSGVNNYAAIIPYINIDAIITCTSFQKDPVASGKFETPGFQRSWNSLWTETDLMKKLFPVSATGFAHSAYCFNNRGSWGTNGIAGPIVGFALNTDSSSFPVGQNTDSPLKLLFSNIYRYTSSNDSKDPSTYSYTLGGPFTIGAGYDPSSAYFFELVGDELTFPIYIGAPIAVSTAWDSKGESGGMYAPASGSFSDVVTDNY